MSRWPAPASPALERALDRATGQSAIPGNRVALLFDGPDNYDAMLALIAGAERRIHLENYIIRDDTIGTRFAEALIARAREGVVVRVLHDWLGSFGTAGRFWRRLREGGVAVRGFGPPRASAPLALISRDHRKVLVVDGHRAVTGGLCIGDEWLGDPARQRQPWRDTAVAVEGPAARVIDHSFARVWAASGGAAYRDEDEVVAQVAQAGGTAVRVVATRPGEERTWRTIDLLLGVSAERIWVTEAYLAGPRRLYQALEDAARDAVDVRLLVPGASDIPLVRNLSRTGYRRLLRSGARIWEWGGPMLHAKTISLDRRWIRVGSSNLNPSSLIANWELDLVVEDHDLATALDHRFAEDLADSGEVVQRERRLLPAVPGLGKPTALVVPDPGPERAHRPSLRERRHRAFVRAAVIGRAARAALLATAAGSLAAGAVLLVLFPRVAAWATAAIFALASVGLSIQALRQRRLD